MGRKRRTAEPIIHRLRETEVDLAKGQSAAAACRKLGIAELISHDWRKEYGPLRLDQARRLKQLEKEHARLKKLVVDQGAGHRHSRGGGPGRLLSP